MSHSLHSPLAATASRPVMPLLAAAVAASLIAACAGDPGGGLGAGLTATRPTATGSLASVAADAASTAIPQPRAAAVAAVAAATPVLTTAQTTAKSLGLDALAAGDLAKAERLLRQAIDPKAPDWHVHSGLGVALAAAGKQQAAQVELAKALALAPDHPSVLNNLALSYVLDGKPEAAEPLLRRIAAADASPRVRQNLALVLGARGQHEEARRLAGDALPPPRAEANRAYVGSLGPAGGLRSTE